MNGREKLVDALRTALMSYSNLRNVNIDESSLIHVASAMTIEHYGSGDNIMSEGMIAKKFYVIHSGQCEVLRSTGTFSSVFSMLHSMSHTHTHTLEPQVPDDSKKKES